MKGHIFESAVVSEIIKKYYNAGQQPRLYYWRDSNNKEKEIDLIAENPQGLELTEIKSSRTANMDYAKNLKNFKPQPPQTVKSRLIIYDGSEEPKIAGVSFINWKSLSHF
jgi:predicted AAA+ superfamily ATPase